MVGRIAGLTVLALLVACTGVAGAAPTPLRMNVVKVSQKNGGGEPSIAAGPEGNLYVSYPSDKGMSFYRSFTHGRTWRAGAIPESSSGDTSVNVDQSGAVYESNLSESSTPPLQGRVYKSFNFGKTFPQMGVGPIEDNATNQPFFVDREWTDAYIPPRKTTGQARVYIEYHDFAPSQVWVNTSKDGGRHFNQPVDIVSSPAAQASTFCNSIPGGIKVVQSGPHAGRIYAAWLAADVATSAATGCNITQADTFHSIWIAWSDDEGKTWTDHLAFDGGFGHDASVLFADLTLDNKGNPYIAFGDNLFNDYFDMFVEASFNGGTRWNGKTDGTGRPYKVNRAKGTHFFPAIAAGDPGKVDVSYIATSKKIATNALGKAMPGGGAGGVWYVYAAQSLNLRSGHPTWSVTKVTPTPMHYGDVCNLGIFCIPGVSNRNLLDFIDATVDRKCLLHVAFTGDTTKQSGIFVANQTGGKSVCAERRRAPRRPPHHRRPHRRPPRFTG